jgi:hypothetical protein
MTAFDVSGDPIQWSGVGADDHSPDKQENATRTVLEKPDVLSAERPWDFDPDRRVARD